MARGSNTVQFVFLGDSKDAERAMARLQDAATKTGNSAEQMGTRLTAAGKKLQAASLLMAAGLGAAGKAFIDFESSFAGVRKTVDASEAEFAALADSFRTLAKEIPLSVNEINAIGEAAGQLGIRKENIEGFTRVMADLGVATNLTSEQAATAFARFANITQMPQEEFDRLGSAVVALGNNLATTESEISEFGLRIAGAGSQIGLTEAEILGLGAALSSVGINAEAGGTAVSKVMINMAQAASMGGEELENFATVAGMSASEFATKFRDDAAGALVAFIEGLGKVDERGGDLFATLEELGITEVRMRDAMLRTAGAGDLVARSMGLANDAFAENTALTEEAEQRYGTLESKLQLAKNRLYDVGITLGETVAPVMLSLANAAATLGEAFVDLPVPVRNTAVALGLVTVAASPLLRIGGAITGVWGKFNAQLAATQASGAAAGRGLAAASVGMRAFNTAAAGLIGLFNPVTLVIGAATAAMVLYSKHKREAKQRVEDFAATLDEETGAVTENTRAHVINRLEQEGAIKAARELGIRTKVLVDALLEGGDAIGLVEAAHDRLRAASAANADQMVLDTKAIGDQDVALNILRTALGAVAAEQQKAIDEKRRDLEVQAEAKKTYLDVAHALKSGMTYEMYNLSAAHGVTQKTAEELAAAVADGSMSMEEAKAAAEAAGIPQHELAEAFGETGEEAETAAEKVRDLIAAERELTDPVIAAQGALDRLRDAEANLDKVRKDKKSTSADIIAAEREIEVRALELDGALRTLGAGFADGTVSIEALTERMQDLRDRGILPASEDIPQLVQDLLSLAGEYTASVTVDDSGARGTIDGLIARLRALGFTQGDAAWSARLEAHAQAVTSRPAPVQRTYTPVGRSHTGDVITPGMPGRAPGLGFNERLRILEVGEEVIPADDPRHRRNLGLVPRLHTGGTLAGAGGGLTAAGFIDIPQLLRITRGPSAGSAREHEQSIDRLQAAYERVTRALEAQEQASRRAELVEQARIAKAEAAEARREIAAAKTAKARDAAREAAERAAEQAQRAAKAVADFDRQAELAAQRRVIEERIAQAEINNRIKANLEAWEFENAAAEDQLEIIRRRIQAEREGTDEWLQLKRQERQLAKQLTDERKRAEEQLAKAVQDRVKATAEAEQAYGRQMAEQAARHQQAVADAHKRATDQIRDTIEARRQALTASLTDRPGEGPWGTDASTLADNIRAQIDNLTEWGAELDRLKARGVDQGVIDALGLGDSPEALNQIRVLLDSTDAELDQLNAAFLDRTRAIDQRIGVEQLQSESQLSRDITDIRRELHAQVQQLERDNAARVEEIRQAHLDRVGQIEQQWAQAQEQFVAQLGDLGNRQGAAIGEQMAKGLLDAIPAVTAAKAALDAAAGGSTGLAALGVGGSGGGAVANLGPMVAVLNQILAELRRARPIYLNGVKVGDALAAGAMVDARSL